MQKKTEYTSIKKLLFKKENLLLIGGFIIILFSSTWLFTRPNLFESYNFNETGPIGDTIGGITAPILNLTGAILIYLSFQAQIEANKIQFNTLNKQLSDQEKDSNYKKTLDFILLINEEVIKFNHNKHTGAEALNLFQKQIQLMIQNQSLKKSKLMAPIFHNWIICITYFNTINRLLSNLDYHKNDKKILNILTNNIWATNFKTSSNTIKEGLKFLNLQHSICNKFETYTFLKKNQNFDK